MGAKWPICLEQNFFWYKPSLLLSSTYSPFSLCKILKKILQRIQSYGDAPFLSPKWSICHGPNNFFLENQYHSHLPISPFSLCKILKKFLLSELWRWKIFGPKMVHFIKWEFFHKTCWWALFFSFMATYMPKIKVRYTSISEILTIKEYWNLIGPEPLFAIIWETRFFPSMQFSQNVNESEGLSLTQIRDKTNDKIFLKSPKTMYLGHFWAFLPKWRFFPEKCRSQHNYTWDSNTTLRFRKN